MLQITWILGIILCLFNLWLLKNSETVEYHAIAKPALRMWIVLIIIPGMFVPGIGLVLGVTLSVAVWTAYPFDVIRWRKSRPFTETKLGKFLNKEIS